MNLVGRDGLAARAVQRLRRLHCLVALEHRLDVQEAEPRDAAGLALDAGRIGDGPTEHLETAAETEHVAAASSLVILGLSLAAASDVLSTLRTPRERRLR